ncbi:MAG: glutamate--tRNA ligase [Phycisphaerae bacterium]|nr:glutamate--tRNA ligase [Phycisphaerae bacterium]
MTVTRFAPSPTGYLHVGGARTALFCWLMAKHNKGKMILRIEDTDQKRNTPTAAQQVMDDLRWLGITWDEGPEVDGPNGPYYQSERRDIYDRYMKQLLEKGSAYYCFDTPEELNALRQEAIAQKKNFAYPRPERFPDEQEVAKAQAEGRPVTVRFAMPNTDIIVHDIVRGAVRFGVDELNDFVIQKSDGVPSYHFACVVDDELMEVSHILRGQEHLMNTPGHIALQDALGFRRPQYAHMSVTISEGGGKLSKREQSKTLRNAIKTMATIDLEKVAEVGGLSADEMATFMANKSNPDAPQISAMAEYLGVHLPEINVIDFLKSGYIPEGMINFIALLGWSPGDDKEIMALDELIQLFDITRLTKSNSLFDRQKLTAFNTEHMKMVAPERLLEHFKRYLAINDLPMGQADDATLAHILTACQGARTLADVAAKCNFLYQDVTGYDPKAIKKVLKKEGVKDILIKIRTALDSLDNWDDDSINKAVEELCTQNDVGMGKIAQPIRVAITGSMVSPSIHDSLVLLGKERTLGRIDQLIEFMDTL